MKWDPEIGQLGFRQSYTKLNSEDWTIVTSILFCTQGPRVKIDSVDSLPINVLIEKRVGVSQDTLYRNVSYDPAFNTEYWINAQRMVERRLATNEDITDLFKSWSKKSYTQHDKWIVNLRKKLVDTNMLSVIEYTRLTVLIEPFLPYHPLNRYR